MICFSCGENLSEDLAYCTNCGRPLEAETVIRKAPPALTETAGNFDKFAVVTAWAAKNLLFAIVAAAVLIGVYYLIVR